QVIQFGNEWRAVDFLDSATSERIAGIFSEVQHLVAEPATHRFPMDEQPLPGTHLQLPGRPPTPDVPFPTGLQLPGSPPTPANPRCPLPDLDHEQPAPSRKPPCPPQGSWGRGRPKDGPAGHDGAHLGLGRHPAICLACAPGSGNHVRAMTTGARAGYVAALRV